MKETIVSKKGQYIEPVILHRWTNMNFDFHGLVKQIWCMEGSK